MVTNLCSGVASAQWSQLHRVFYFYDNWSYSYSFVFILEKLENIDKQARGKVITATLQMAYFAHGIYIYSSGF